MLSKRFMTLFGVGLLSVATIPTFAAPHIARLAARKPAKAVAVAKPAAVQKAAAKPAVSAKKTEAPATTAEKKPQPAPKASGQPRPAHKHEKANAKKDRAAPAKKSARALAAANPERIARTTLH